MNTFEQIHKERQDGEPKVTGQINDIIENFSKRAENEGLEIETQIFPNNTKATISIKVLLRPISANTVMEEEPIIFEETLRSDQWKFASDEQTSSWQKQIEENYLKESQKIFIIIGRRLLTQEARKPTSSAKPVTPINTRGRESGESGVFKKTA